MQYKLIIRCYYVAPLIKKILSPFTVAFSATIGNKEIFGFETGIWERRKRPAFLSLPSLFPVDNTRVYLPTDTPNLAEEARRSGDLPKVLRQIAKACKRLAQKGYRSLVVTISNAEREKFLTIAAEENLDVISYGNGITPKQAALVFRDENKGDVLVGTAANYAEGLDLPKQTAPVIFFLRPGYPNPDEPGTIFEERRWGSQRWALWNWRVMQQVLQVRGRNVRSRSDVGVCFFISQQFRRILFAALPDWLKKAYRRDMTLKECLEDAETPLNCYYEK